MVWPWSYSHTHTQQMLLFVWSFAFSYKLDDALSECGRFMDSARDFFLKFKWTNKKKESRIDTMCNFRGRSFHVGNFRVQSLHIYCLWEGNSFMFMIADSKEPKHDSFAQHVTWIYQVRLCLRSFFRFRAPWRSLVINSTQIRLINMNYIFFWLNTGPFPMQPFSVAGWSTEGFEVDVPQMGTDWHPEVDLKKWHFFTLKDWHFFAIDFFVAHLPIWKRGLLSTVQYLIIP